MRTMMATMGLILCLPLQAMAQMGLHQIETIPATPMAGSAFQIRVTGSWPNTCAPEVMPVVVDGVNIDVSVRQRDAICGAAITPYSVVVDPAAVAPAGFPAPRIYRVRFSIKDAINQPKLLAFRTVDMTAPSAHDVQPEAGFWTPDVQGEFQTSGSGIGFMVERQGTTLAMTTNAYTLNGQTAWYLSAGAIARSSFRGDLLRSIGGQPLWGTYRGAQSVEPAGNVDIEFSTNSTAVVWYARPSGDGIFDELELMPISIHRMNFALAADGRALAGVWAFSGYDQKSPVSPKTIRFTYREDRILASEAILVSEEGYELRCVIDPEQAEVAPSVCRLLFGGSDVARFDNNGLTRLSGHSANGDDITLVRLSD
ncbi:MAG: hypothetical protein R3F18_12235 [Lysobacterales bacterium]|nr:hypothetical protein [Xanthomonadales bacterium]